MEPCTVKPYNGKEGYIFVCYSHADEYRVFPLIEELALKGFRIWYDRGIAPGESWPEVIGERLNGCRVFLVAQTAASDASHNCRNEINLAVSLGKTIVGVQLEDVRMSLAMRLQLGGVQWVTARKHPGSELIREICRCKALKECVGLVDRAVRVIKRSSPDGEEKIPVHAIIEPDLYDSVTVAGDIRGAAAAVYDKKETVDPIAPVMEKPGEEELAKDQPVAEANEEPAKEIKPAYREVKQPSSAVQEQKKPKPIQPIKKEEKRPSPSVQEPKQPEPIKKQHTPDKPVKPAYTVTESLDAAPAPKHAPEDDPGATVYLPGNEEDPNKTVLISDDEGSPVSKTILPLIIRVSTGEVFDGMPLLTVIGREAASADIAIPAPDRSISRAHVTLIVHDGHYFASDMDSANGTFVNGRRLEKNESTEIGEFAEIGLAREKLLVLNGSKAEAYRCGAHIGALSLQGAEETKYIFADEPFFIGREYPWTSDCMEDHAISRRHATIAWKENSFELTDSSTNGSAVIRHGGERVKLKKQTTAIESGDILVFGRQEFTFRVL